MEPVRNMIVGKVRPGSVLCTSGWPGVGAGCIDVSPCSQIVSRMVGDSRSTEGRCFVYGVR